MHEGRKTTSRSAKLVFAAFVVLFSSTPQQKLGMLSPFHAAEAALEASKIVYQWDPTPAQPSSLTLSFPSIANPSTTKNIYLLRLSSLDQIDFSTQTAMQGIRATDPTILQDYNIHIVKRNTQYKLGQSMRAAFEIIGDAVLENVPVGATNFNYKNQPLQAYAAIMGPDFCIEILSIAEEVPIYNLMTISTHLTTWQLADTIRFPNTFRVGPKDRDYNEVTLHLAKNSLGADAVGFSYVSASYAVDRVNDFKKYITEAGYKPAANADSELMTMSVAYAIPFDSNTLYDQAVAMSKHNEVYYNIIIDMGYYLNKYACEAVLQPGDNEVYYNNNAYIVAGPFIRPPFWTLPAGDTNCTAQQMRDAFVGTFIIESYKDGNLSDPVMPLRSDGMTISQFVAALNASSGTGFSTWDDGTITAISGYAYYQYDLIYALITALDRVDKKMKNNTLIPPITGLADLGDLSNHRYTEPVYQQFTQALINEVGNSNFAGLTGTVVFDSNQDRIGDITITQLQDLDKTLHTLQKVVVGRYYGATKTTVVHTELCHYGTADDKPPNDKVNQTPAIAGGVVGGVLGLAGLIGLIVWFHRRSVAQKEYYLSNWLVPWSAVQTGKRASGEQHGGSQRATQQSIRSTQEARSAASRGTMQSKTSAGTKNSASMGTMSVEMYEKHFAVVYDFEKVWMKEFEHPLKVTANSTPLQLNMHFPTARILNKIGADNLAKFIGITMPSRDESSFCYVLFRFMPKNSLAHLLGNETIELSDDFKSSILRDLVAGVIQLANTDLGSHGFLHANNIVVDSRFTAFITDYGVPFAHEEYEFQALTVQAVHNLEDGFVQKLFYRAPELLRGGLPPHGTKKGDVYSLGIVMAQIMTRKPPFRLPDSESDRKVPEVRSQLFDIILGTLPLQRPDLSYSSDQGLKNVIQDLWLEDPNPRPDPPAVLKSLKKLPNFFQGSILDNLIKRLEAYAVNLEKTITDRTLECHEEKMKTEQLLYQILPHSVAEALKAGQPVMPEAFPMVTIYFSDIIGFTSLVTSSAPLQVVTLLNGVYSLFDGCIGLFDAYKVETIGDAYMVVSGLPDRNGDMHSAEIARLALSLLGSVKTFKIPHRPGESLHMRIGLNAGNVVAGVVGLIMPRYCLFGDTVNVASRMESTSEADCIHCSQLVHEHITEHFPGNFNFEERGEMPIKGKGVMKTYWLLSTNMPLHILHGGGAQVDPIRIFSARTSFV